MVLARDGYFYVGGKTKVVDGHTYVVDQMYVDFRIPAQQTHPYPIVMVHGGTRSGTTYTGTPDGREGWAQYFVRRGYAVYVVDQPGRGRSGYSVEDYGPSHVADMEGGMRRYLAQEKFNLWPQAHLHTQWPGSGAPDDPVTIADGVELSAGDRGFHQAAIPQSRFAGGAVRQDRPCHPDGALAGRRLRLAGGRCAAATGQSHRRRRAEWPAILRRQFIGAPDWFKQGNSPCPMD